MLSAALGACAPVERGAPGTDGEEARLGAVWRADLRAEPVHFALPSQREVKVVFSLRNSSRRLVRLDFPTGQHLEVKLCGPDGRVLFLWSEDRSFAPQASVVTVNPGERLEFEAEVPTRDMVAGGTYAVEALLVGHPETATTLVLHPL